MDPKCGGSADRDWGGRGGKVKTLAVLKMRCRKRMNSDCMPRQSQVFLSAFFAQPFLSVCAHALGERMAVRKDIKSRLRKVREDKTK